MSRKLQTMQKEIHNIKELAWAYLITRDHTQTYKEIDNQKYKHKQHTYNITAYP